MKQTKTRNSKNQILIEGYSTTYLRILLTNVKVIKKPPKKDKIKEKEKKT